MEPEEIEVGDYIEKVTGDYRIKGHVRSVFKKGDKTTRVVVEHKAEGGGSFLHIYSPLQLQKIEEPQFWARPRPVGAR